VRLNPRVIVSAPLPAHLAAQRATSTIPVVMATGADPVGFGLVASLSRPGGNVTGLANFAETLAPKQIDLLREMVRRLARFGLLVNVTNPTPRAATARDQNSRHSGRHCPRAGRG
jgi:putative tryptophan/tyrosine transport system substrate-binding protein